MTTNTRWTERQLSNYFKVKSGDYHAIAELDPGKVPLISCGEVNNGLVGNFNIPKNKTYHGAITVAYNGRPLTAKFHPYRFGAKDDVAVLLPKLAFQVTTLLYVAAVLDRMKWRYSYGRKCFREKLVSLQIRVPVKNTSDSEELDENAIRKIFSEQFEGYIPRSTTTKPIQVPRIRWKVFNLPEIFDMARGDFHSLTALKPGYCKTVSRISENNGVVGYFTPPEGAKIYPKGTITISTVGGDSFVQLDEFIATDNVIVCVPQKALKITSLFFIALVLNLQKWRYSYGRQCYYRKSQHIRIYLPSTKNGELDEETMEAIVKQTSYWPRVERVFEQLPA